MCDYMNQNKKLQKDAQDTSAIRDGVLQQIAAGSVQPRPRWHFIARNALLWLSGVLLLLIGASSVSVVIFLVRGHAWEMREVFGLSVPKFLLHTFPFIWLLAYIVFLGIAEIVIRKTRGTYRYNPFLLSLVILITSAFVGIFFYALQISDRIDTHLGKHVPRIYQTLDQRRTHLMHRPDNGRVMGVVQTVTDTHFDLRHPRSQKALHVDFASIPDQKRSLIIVGQKVLCLGTWNVDRSIFEASDVLSPPPKRDRRFRGR